MKKFNLFKEIIILDKQSLLNAINSSKTFGINIKGDIIFEPFKDKEILIFSGKHIHKKTSAMTPSKAPSLSDTFGKNYQVIEDEGRILIKAFSNWQELISLNMPRASYDDTTGDGVAEFSNKELEDIGWHATEFDISYRTLVEITEEACEGTLLCIEQEEPYQFSGLGFFDDDKKVKEVMFQYCQKELEKLISQDPLYAKETLNDDETAAAKFFKVI